MVQQSPALSRLRISSSLRIATAAAALLLSTSAGAAVLTVDTELDVVNPVDGLLSLREALVDAIAGDEIQFDASLDGETIVLLLGQLVIDRDLTITGPGADLLTIDANALSRVVSVTTGVTAKLSGLTIRNGDNNTGGGGILTFGPLEVRDCVIEDNVGAPNTVGGGIHSSVSLLLERTLVRDSTGEGIRVQNGSSTIIDSTISGSTAAGIVVASGSGATLIVGSTISGNSGSGAGGGIHNGSSGVTITLVNSTVSGNTASAFGGGIWAGGGDLNLFNSTVTDNTGTTHGGGVTRGSFSPGVVSFHNSIVAGNTAPTDADCSVNTPNGSWATDDYNLFGTGTGCPVGATDLTVLDAANVVAPLADNGGSTETHALLDRPNPAIDHGDPTGCKDAAGLFLQADQRGEFRRMGKGCDIGAFEAPRAVPALPAWGLALLGASLFGAGLGHRRS